VVRSGPTLAAGLVSLRERGPAVATHGARTKGSAQQIAMVYLDELVPEDDPTGDRRAANLPPRVPP
jgi:hypothetical protein